MIDINYKVWLIEVNTNPWIEESSNLLEKYIPRMIDDALWLTIDKNWVQKSAFPWDENQKCRVSPFPIPNYEDTKNLWKQILNLSI